MILITHQSWIAQRMAHALHDQLKLDAILVQGKEVQHAPPKYKKILREWRALLQRRDAVGTKEFALKRHADKFLKKQWPVASENWPAGVEIKAFEDINSLETQAWVKTKQPQALILFGTAILQKSLLDTVPYVFNAHTSILPAYRGSFVEFWQVYKKDFDHAGITVHLVTEDVDAGDILHQEKYQGPLHVDPFMLRAHNLLAMKNCYANVIEKFLRQEIVAQPQKPSTERAYRGKDMTINCKKELYQRFC